MISQNRLHEYKWRTQIQFTVFFRWQTQKGTSSSLSKNHSMPLWLFMLTVFLLVAFTIQVEAYSPATGPINTMVSFSPANSASNGPYSLTKSSTTSGTTITTTITVTRPSLPNYIFSESGSNLIVTYSFISTDWLLIKTSESNTVNVTYALIWVRLNVNEPEKYIYNRNDFVTDSPNPQVYRNSDGLAFFTKVFLANAAISDVFEIAVYRTDTGDSICGMGPVNREPSHTITAEITGTSVIITWNRPPFSPVVQTCPLPAPNLTVTPLTLDFGDIRADMTDDKSITLSNTGTDSITINSISSAGAFSPVGFSGITLDAGDTSAVTIRFNPAGVISTFDEHLTISRTPAVGVDRVHTIGSSRDPAPRISVTPSSVAFPLTNVGTTATRTFVVANIGDLPLGITSYSGPTNTVYSVTPSLAPRTINKGSPVTFTVSFSPTAATSYPDNIGLTTTDPLNPTVTIPISGQGHIPLPKFVIDPTVTSLTYGDVEVGYRFGKGIRVRNEGDANLVFDVTVTGDTRYSFSQTPTMPGPGVRGPSTITIPASPLGGPYNELILRVTFDASSPTGGPYTGTLTINNINDTTASPVTVSLTGSVVPGHTLDVALALDRSGSMSETTGFDTKIGTVKRASRLFFNLLRPDVGDRAALIQYNTSADVLKSLTAITTASRSDFITEINDATNLSPSGRTSITAGLLKAFDELTDTSRDIRAVLIVSDGKENTSATVGGTTYTLDDVPIPTGIAVHSLGLGRSDNIDQVKLENIATRSGGSSNITGDFQGLELFGVEKFFLQIATTILGGTTALDPVIRIQSGQEFTSRVTLIPADKEVTFSLLYKNGVLPYQIIAPDGTVFPSSTPPPDFAMDLFEPRDASILRLKLPTDKPDRYKGEWRIVVRHDSVVYKGEGPQRDSSVVKGPIDYALHVSLLSNLRLLGMLSPQTIYVGDPILVTAFLSEEGIPVLNANIDVTVLHPDQTTTSVLTLYDDGAHNDGDANDGEYASEFRQTAMAGAYSFTYHAVGTSARGGNFVRETSLGKHVVGRDVSKPKDTKCCNRLVRWLKIIAIILTIDVVSDFIK